MNRNLQSFLVIVSVCWCCLSVTPAVAQIVYDNGTPNKEGGFLSDNDAGVRFADDFRFGTPTLFNAIRFWGFYSPTDTPPVNDAFTVVFYGNGGGLPDGGNILSTHVIGNAGRTDTGEDTNGGCWTSSFMKRRLATIRYPRANTGCRSTITRRAMGTTTGLGRGTCFRVTMRARSTPARLGCTSSRTRSWRFS
jgi:hypothetical protein